MAKRYSVNEVKRLAVKEDLDGLIEVIKSSDHAEVTVQAAGAFTSLAATQEVDLLLSRLKALDVRPRIAEDEHDETREEFVWGLFADALGSAAEPRSPAASALLAVLEWPDGTPCRSAMLALAEMGERRAVEPLLRRLEGIDYASEDAIRGELAFICEAFGTLKAVEAVDPLCGALELARDGREWVAEALGDIGDPRAIPALAAQLEPEPPLFVGNAIWNALNQIGTPEAKAAVAAWEARNETPPDAHEWRAERIPPSVIRPLGEWWYSPRAWLERLAWERKKRH